jgi:hypothetical protein
MDLACYFPFSGLGYLHSNKTIPHRKLGRVPIFLPPICAIFHHLYMGKIPTRRVGYGGFHPKMAKLAEKSVKCLRKTGLLLVFTGQKMLRIAEN